MRSSEWIWKELKELQRMNRERAMEQVIRSREQANRYYNPDHEELDIMESELY